MSNLTPGGGAGTTTAFVVGEDLRDAGALTDMHAREARSPGDPAAARGRGLPPR